MCLKHKKVTLFAMDFVIIVLMAIVLSVWIKTEEYAETDVVEINRIIQEAQQNQNNLINLDHMTFTYDFCIINHSNTILYMHGNADTTWEQNVKDNNTYGFMYNKDEVVGTILIQTNGKEELKQEQRQMIVVVMALLFVSLLIGNGFYFYLDAKILIPFQKLQVFAGDVAAGNLDTPLQMDRGQIFGAFTESFDILREELKKAREQEYLANVSKKELVASLSHDIKTPVTSIKLISEVLLTKYTEPQLRNRLTSIYHKADQIDSLVSDMFHSTLEELGELQVHRKDVYSSELITILKNADFKNMVNLCGTVPQCLVCVDLLRVEQVIGNIIYNSYKYADTVIAVTFQLQQNYLEMHIKDYGAGVPEEELPLIFQKFYRGKDTVVQEKSGAGLGLYLCRNLMEKMGGSIQGFNEADGFLVKLLFALSE